MERARRRAVGGRSLLEGVGALRVEPEDALRHIVEVELPARALVEEELRGRQAVHASGEVVVFASGGCPWKTHLYELERSMGVAPLVKFVLYEDSAKMGACRR